jgi:hypothetical protein
MTANGEAGYQIAKGLTAPASWSVLSHDLQCPAFAGTRPSGEQTKANGKKPPR